MQRERDQDVEATKWTPRALADVSAFAATMPQPGYQTRQAWHEARGLLRELVAEVRRLRQALSRIEGAAFLQHVPSADWTAVGRRPTVAWRRDIPTCGVTSSGRSRHHLRVYRGTGQQWHASAYRASNRLWTSTPRRSPAEASRVGDDWVALMHQGLDAIRASSTLQASGNVEMSAYAVRLA
jgi:hypothetical protein